MSRSTMLIVLGALVMVSPFSGLPLRILTWILPILGLIALGIGVSFHLERRRLTKTERMTHEAPVPASS